MEHLSPQQIASYRNGSLSATELLDVSDHLAECEMCRGRVSEDDQIAAMASTVRRKLEPEWEAFSHLTYDQMAAYVDGASAGEETAGVNRHIRDCEKCAAGIAELRVVRAEINSDQAHPSQSRRWGSLWSAVYGWSGLLVFAAAAVCVVLVVTLRPREPRRVAEAPRAAQPATTAPATVIIDGARQISVGPRGVLAGLDGLQASVREAVVQALATRRIEVPPVLAELASKRDVLLGEPAPSRSADLLAPVGVILEEQNPTFRWKPLTGAEYQVKVYTVDFQPAVESGWIHQPEWHCPQTLRRGARYSWQLTLRRGGEEFTSPAPPAPEARFQILNAESEEDLVRLRAADGGSHLVLGIAYARAGLLEQARQELRAAAAQNPASATVADLFQSLNSSPPQSK